MIDYTDDDRLPVTILTGFLGAGKTTLFNHLIKTNPDSKFEVIENDVAKSQLNHRI